MRMAGTRLLLFDEQKRAPATRLKMLKAAWRLPDFRRVVQFFGNSSMPVLLRILCRRCRSAFYICRSCYRGQRYCGDSCRHQSRREQKRASNKRHRESPEGRLDNRDRVRRFRARKRAEVAIVMDQGSAELSSADNLDFDGYAPKKMFGVMLLVALVAGHLNSDPGAVDENDDKPHQCKVCGACSAFCLGVQTGYPKWRPP